MIATFRPTKICGIAAGERIFRNVSSWVAQVARAAGATEVVVTDINDERLARAAELGATVTVNTAAAELDHRDMDRLIECSAHPAALWQGIQALGPGARATVVGQSPPTVDGLPLGYLQRWEIDLSTAFRYAHAFPAAIALAASGRVDLAGILTGRFPLERAADAIRAPGLDPRHLKVVIRPAMEHRAESLM